MGRRAGVTPDETRDELLDAAITVLRANGYEGARVADIAREARLTTGAIYTHFGSKAELLAAAVARHGPGAVDHLLAAGDTARVLDAVRAAGGRLAPEVAAAAPLLVELAAAAARDPEVGEVVRAALDDRRAAVAEVVDVAQRNGEIDPVLEPAALTRLALLLGLGSAMSLALGLDQAEAPGWPALVDRLVRAVQAGGEE